MQLWIHTFIKLSKAFYPAYMYMHHSYVTGSAKTGLITHNRKPFFGTNTKIHQYTIKFHYQNEAALSGLFCWLLFPSTLAIHTSDLGP